MFAYSNEFQVSNLFLYFVNRSLKLTFLYCCASHCGWKYSEIEISYVSFVSLEVRIVFEEFVKFVSSGLPLKKDVFAVFFELFFNFDSNCIRKNAFSCSKLDINELRCDQFVFICFLCDQLGLKVVVSNVFQALLFVTFNEM